MATQQQGCGSRDLNSWSPLSQTTQVQVLASFNLERVAKLL